MILLPVKAIKELKRKKEEYGYGREYGFGFYDGFEMAFKIFNDEKD